MHRVLAAAVTSVVIAATVGCNGAMKTAPTATTAQPESSGDTFVVQSAGGHEIWLRAAGPSDSRVQAADAPTGAFQTTPAADGEWVIRAFVDDLVVISGARFSPGRPDDELKVEVEWGDGDRSTAGCGPCRVEHSYRPGRYEQTATIHDRRLADRGAATHTYTVIVSGPAEPAATGPAVLPPNCHTITKANGACPTGAVSFCVSDPVVNPSNPAHALAACNTCFGPGACSNFNVTCFGGPTTSFQAAASLAHLNTGFVYNRTSASGPVAGDTADFLLPGCPGGGRWAN